MLSWYRLCFSAAFIEGLSGKGNTANEDDENEGPQRAPQQRVVWQRRPLGNGPPRLAARRRFQRARIPGKAGDRRVQLLERTEQLQRAPAPGGRSRQTRRVGGRRISSGIPYDLAGRNADEAHHHALPQPDG